MRERNRVARELHDVLAHNLSVLVVQAGAARRIVERNPERAAEVAALIELTGREALAELLHLFGPVRREDGGAPGEQPGAGERIMDRALLDLFEMRGKIRKGLFGN